MITNTYLNIYKKKKEKNLKAKDKNLKISDLSNSQY